MGITTKQKQSEIDKFETRSLEFIKIFGVLWSAIIYFIFRDAAKIAPTFADNFSLMIHNAGIPSKIPLAALAYYWLLLVIVFAALTFVTLVKNLIYGIQDYLPKSKGEKVALDLMWRDKQKNLSNGIAIGYLTTIFFLIFLVMIFFIKEKLLNDLVASIFLTTISIVMITVLGVMPLVEFVKNDYSGRLIKRVTYALNDLFSVAILIWFASYKIGLNQLGTGGWLPFFGLTIVVLMTSNVRHTFRLGRGVSRKITGYFSRRMRLAD